MSFACLTANQMSFIDNFVWKEQFAGWPPSVTKWSPNRGDWGFIEDTNLRAIVK